MAQSGRLPKVLPAWIRLVPFLLSGFLFLSGVFAVFAPLPLLLLAFQSNRRWLYLAAFSNATLVVALGGSISFGIYLSFMLALSLSLPEFLRSRKRIESAVGLTLLVMALVGALVVAAYAQVHHVNPLTELKNQVLGLVDQLAKTLAGGTRDSLLEGVDPEEWKHGFLIELPSAVAIFALVVVWANLVAVLRMNPKGIREQLGLDPTFFKKWKAPEFLLWPTVIAGFFQVVDFGMASDIAMNVFRFLMAIYALQGLSILSFLFDVWNLKGAIRSLGFLVAVFLMMPLLLSIGFFDLWFDFRAKLRQS